MNQMKMKADAESGPAQKKTKMDDKYLPELQAEKDSLDSSFTHAMKLINAGKKEGEKKRKWFSFVVIVVGACYVACWLG